MWRALVLMMLLCGFAPSSHAVRVPGLYEAEVIVQDQSNSARAQGVLNALRAVIVKITGDRSAPGREEAVPILRAADRYLLQFRYEERERPGPEDAAPVRDLYLWAQFAQEALERDLRGAGLPIWGAERPSTLAWIAIGDGASGWRWVAGEGGDGSLQQLLDARARGRGLGLIFPLGDLEDASRIGAAAVGAQDVDAIAAASGRYGADSVLSGAVSAAGAGTWQVEWVLQSGGQVERWRSEAAALDAVLREGMDGLADRLAQRFAATGAGPEEGGIRVDVIGVDTATGYARTLHYLESLSAVTSVQVTEVERDRVTFVLAAYGGRDAVRQAIGLGRVLVPEGPDGWRLAR